MSDGGTADTPQFSTKDTGGCSHSYRKRTLWSARQLDWNKNAIGSGIGFNLAPWKVLDMVTPFYHIPVDFWALYMDYKEFIAFNAMYDSYEVTGIRVKIENLIYRTAFVTGASTTFANSNSKFRGQFVIDYGQQLAGRVLYTPNTLISPVTNNQLFMQLIYPHAIGFFNNGSSPADTSLLNFAGKIALYDYVDLPWQLGIPLCGYGAGFLDADGNRRDPNTGLVGNGVFEPDETKVSLTIAPSTLQTSEVITDKTTSLVYNLKPGWGKRPITQAAITTNVAGGPAFDRKGTGPNTCMGTWCSSFDFPSTFRGHYVASSTATTDSIVLSNGDAPVFRDVGDRLPQCAIGLNPIRMPDGTVVDAILDFDLIWEMDVVGYKSNSGMIINTADSVVFDQAGSNLVNDGALGSFTVGNVKRRRYDQASVLSSYQTSAGNFRTVENTTS